MLRALGPGDTRGPAWQREPAESATRRDLAALGLAPTVLRGQEDGEGSATGRLPSGDPGASADLSRRATRAVLPASGGEPLAEQHRG